MLRTTISKTTRGALRSTAFTQAPILRSICLYTTVISHRSPSSRNIQGVRWYSAPAGLGKGEIEGRIVDLLKNFDKVSDASKLSNTSHFANDLGLDSLDTVEVVMAIEEEFSIEIPDKEADAIHSIDKAVEYILSQPDAH
ncbi:Acyl carrier protein, mitochondrial [Varicellaria rhodocarpa]|nr:Acyl carrier protein, mitochondrial [Varicellaria rhodocarpa]